MYLDIRSNPFSAPGTYFAVTAIDRDVWTNSLNDKYEGVWLRSVRSGDAFGPLFQLKLFKNGEEVAYNWESTPGELILTAGDAKVRMGFEKNGTVRMQGKGATLVLDYDRRDYCEVIRKSANELYLSAAWRLDNRYLVSMVEGDMVTTEIEGKLNRRVTVGNDSSWEVRISEHRFTVAEDPQPLQPFEDCISYWKKDYADFVAGVCEKLDEHWVEAAHLAAYINWSCQIGPSGYIKERAMVMSKNWMHNIWTWDCQFNAFELCQYDAEKAWANYSVPFWYQHETGMLPDTVSDHDISVNYTKPPVHGWSQKKLREEGVLVGERLNIAYDRLGKLVNGWYNTMDWDGDGVCQYLHGNDSGWDNCSYFGKDRAIEGPDLAAYLILCLFELEEEAKALGRKAEAKLYHERAELQMKRLLDHCWDGERFHVYENGNHSELKDADSLLPFLVLILGEYLPKDIFNKLRDGLSRFRCPIGVSTEALGSPFYLPDGYWLGPVWAPSTMFIVDGLARGGDKKLATEIARDFCENCRVNGFSENYDAETGKPLRDKAYTWTSSVYLSLARMFLS